MFKNSRFAKKRSGKVMDDETLCGKIKQISEGSESSAREAMHDIYLEMKDSIYTFILLHTGRQNRHLAEDILQDTFVAVYSSAKNFKFHKNPRAWLLAIARNKAISEIRALSRSVSMEGEFFDSEKFSVPFADGTGVESLLSDLSEQDREIVILHVIYGFKHREIAKITKRPLGTITRRYKQSIDSMRENITQNESRFQCGIKNEV
jgi:RNA polymerase sigma-70 factor (ECF subfamily)